MDPSTSLRMTTFSDKGQEPHFWQRRPEMGHRSARLFLWACQALAGFGELIWRHAGFEFGDFGVGTFGAVVLGLGIPDIGVEVLVGVVAVTVDPISHRKLSLRMAAARGAFEEDHTLRLVFRDVSSF